MKFIYPFQNPWIAGFLKDKTLEDGRMVPELWCTGAIINETWILTAAHCFKDGVDRDMIRVVVGAQNLLNVFGEIRQEIDIADIRLHPLYDKTLNSQKAYYDVAMIKLAEEIRQGQSEKQKLDSTDEVNSFTL